MRHSNARRLKNKKPRPKTRLLIVRSRFHHYLEYLVKPSITVIPLRGRTINSAAVVVIVPTVTVPADIPSVLSTCFPHLSAILTACISRIPTPSDVSAVILPGVPDFLSTFASFLAPVLSACRVGGNEYKTQSSRYDSQSDQIFHDFPHCSFFAQICVRALHISMCCPNKSQALCQRSEIFVKKCKDLPKGKWV